MADTTGNWHPGPAEVRAILPELGPLLDRFARRDHELLEVAALQHELHRPATPTRPPILWV